MALVKLYLRRMLKNKFIELIDTLDIKEKVKVKSLLLQAIGFNIDSKHSKSNSSKIGGYPSITNENWPLCNERPLLFLAQINLDEINKMNNLLNLKGTLLFFICTDNVGYRYPTKKDEFKVLYIEDSNEAIANKNFSAIKEYSISFFEYFTFPSYQEFCVEKNNISDEDLEVVEDIENEMRYLIDENLTLDINHQALGHPKAVQGSVKFWWSKQYLGFDEESNLSKEDFKKVRQEEDNFILLLQLNFGDSKIEIDIFGDSVAYYGIHKQDLKNKNFNNVKLVMQNT